MAESLGSFRASDSGLVTIKDRTMIAGSCRIETTSHSLSYLDRHRCKPDGVARPVEIGEDCWLGAGVIVLPGVIIGKGCVVAAGAVVAKDVAPFKLVGGVPAKVIRHLDNLEEPESQGDKSDGENGDIGVEKGERLSQVEKDIEETLAGVYGPGRNQQV